MGIAKEATKDIDDPVLVDATTGFLKNNGVDTKHEIGLMARSSPNGQIVRYEVIGKLEVGYGIRINMPDGEKVVEYWFDWRDDAGRVRYGTERRSAPTGRYFSSIGGWWMTDPDATKAQSFVPWFQLS